MRNFTKKQKNQTKLQNNGKIKSKKATIDGIEFKSTFESKCYIVFKELGWDFQYESHQFTLIPPFVLSNNVYKQDSIRKAIYTPDFVNTSYKIIIECKGHPNDAWPIRQKLFLYYMYTSNDLWDFYIVKNKKSFEDLLIILKDKYPQM